MLFEAIGGGSLSFRIDVFPLALSIFCCMIVKFLSLSAPLVGSGN